MLVPSALSPSYPVPSLGGGAAHTQDASSLLRGASLESFPQMCPEMHLLDESKSSKSNDEDEPSGGPVTTHELENPCALCGS